MNPQMLGRLAGNAWLLYPLLLFLLPKTDIGPFAPITAFALLYFGLCAAVVLFVAPAGRLIELVRGIPLPAVLFAVAVVGLLFFKGGELEWLRAVTWIVVFMLSLLAFADESRFVLLIRMWFWFAAAASVVAILLHGFPLPKEIDFLSWRHRTVFAYFLAVGIIGGLMLLHGGRVDNRWLYRMGVGLILVGLVGSLARGPWLLALIGTVSLDRRARKGAFVALVVFAVLALVLVPSSLLGDVTQRFHSIYDLDVGSSTVYRLNLYRAVLDAIPEVWLNGLSTLQFGPFLAAHSLIRYPFFFDPAFETDSDLIDLLLLGGLPLVLITLWMFIDAMRRSRRDTCPDDLRGMRRALLAAVLMQMCLDNVLSNALGWMLLGIALHADFGRRSIR